MKTIFITTLLVIQFFAVSSQNNQFKNIDASSFEKVIIDKKGTLLDVRTIREYENQHIKDALQLNFYQLDFSQKLLLLPKNEPIYLYCTTGYRSQKAAQILTRNGYTQVYNLNRGIMGWNTQNLPTVQGKSATKSKGNKFSLSEFEELTKSNEMVLIDFYAPWCAPCKKMLPFINNLQEEYKGKVNIKKINVDISQKLVKQLKVTSVPYFRLYKNNKLVWEHYGYITKEALVFIMEEKK